MINLGRCSEITSRIKVHLLGSRIYSALVLSAEANGLPRGISPKESGIQPFNRVSLEEIHCFQIFSKLWVCVNEALYLVFLVNLGAFYQV